MAATFCHFLPDDISGLVSLSDGVLEYLSASVQASPQHIFATCEKPTSLLSSSTILSIRSNDKLDDQQLNHLSIDINVDFCPKESSSSSYKELFSSSWESIKAPFSFINTSTLVPAPLISSFIKTKFRHWYFNKFGNQSQL